MNQSSEGDARSHQDAQAPVETAAEAETRETLDWATQPAARAEELLRSAGEERRVAAEAQIRDEALSCMVGDDMNVFAWHRLLPFTRTRGHTAQAAMTIRTDWERSVTGLPDVVATILAGYRERLNEADWSDEASFKAAMTEWEERKRQLGEVLRDQDGP